MNTDNERRNYHEWPHGTAEKINNWALEQLGFELETWQLDFMRQFEAPKLRTMAEINWDDDVHPYMEAVTVSGRRHIMLTPMGETAVSEITILVAEPDHGLPVLVPAEGLTPTGRYARLTLPPAEDTPEPAPEQGSNCLETLNSSIRPGILKPDPRPDEAWLVGNLNAPHEQFNVIYGFGEYAHDFQGNDWKVTDLIPLSRLVPESELHNLRRALRKQVGWWEEEVQLLEVAIRAEAARKSTSRPISPAEIAAGQIRSSIDAINRILAGETND